MFFFKEFFTLSILPCLSFFLVDSLNNNDCKKALNFWGQNLDKVPKFVFSPCVKKLDLIGNEIVNIEKGAFDNLPNLKELSLLGNRIPGEKMFSFGSLPKLKSLDLSHQYLKSKSEIFINESYPKLEILDLSNVAATKILIKNWTTLLPKLTTLKLGFNQDFDFADLMGNFPPSLTNLKLNNNEISFINLTEFHNLKTVNLNWNNFKSLYITQNPADCRDHDQLCIGWMEGLTELSASFCHIREFQLEYSSADPLPNLRKLDLSLNKLKTLGDLQTTNHNVQKLCSLNYLNLRQNRFESIESLCALQNLSTLDLSFNQDHSTQLVLSKNDDKCLSNLEEFHFAGNELREVPEDFFKNLDKLQKLDLAHNRLNKFPKIISKTLKHLHLNFNNIELEEDLEIEDLKELKILNIAGNRMKEGEVDKLRKKLSVDTVITF